MRVTEFRVVLPITVEEYQVGQLYCVAEVSKNETGGGDGVEVIENRPFDNVPLLGGRFTTGQYTKKIYHLSSKVPSWIRGLAPKGALEVYEEAWNAYPYCKTVISNPEYMKEAFLLKIETMHLPDRGATDNAHFLGPDLLQKRSIVNIDIANDIAPTSKDYKTDTDPKLFISKKTKRGPLTGDWRNSVEPVMCAYKLVTCTFKWWLFQGRVENFIMNAEKRLFTVFHRQLFCWLDQWHGLTMEDIRSIEDKTKQDLDQQRHRGSVKGMSEKDAK